MAHQQHDSRSIRSTVADNEDNIEAASSKVQGDEMLQLQSSDNPGITPVSAPLTGGSFLPWSRSMKIALGAKTKLKFIDGTYEAPSTDSSAYTLWKKVDYMVLSWILNSVSKEIAKSFINAESTRALWKEIEDRYGEGNAPLIYQIHKEISAACQGEMSVT